MASINTPTLDELTKRAQTDVQTQLPESNPFLPNSFILALITSVSGRFEEFYLQFQVLFNALFLTTSTGDFLDAWGTLYSKPRLGATSAQGFINIFGTVSTLIPIGTDFSNANGVTYATTNNFTIQTIVETVNSLTGTGGQTITAVILDGHTFSTTSTVTIAGAIEPEFNGSYKITVLNNTTFTYDIPGTATGTATGTITATSTYAHAEIKSATLGSVTNLPSGSVVTLVNAIVGVQLSAIVELEGVAGGTDDESDGRYKDRLLFRVQNPLAQWSASSITDILLQINGITRVFPFPTTDDQGNTAAGRAAVYFVRDDDDNIIPTASEVAQARAATIVNISFGMLADNYYVLAPTPQVVSFTIDALVPNTATMQDAITANLKAYFYPGTSDDLSQNGLGVGDNVLSQDYTNTIFNTVDPVTGQKVVSFTMISPNPAVNNGDVDISNIEIAILGSVNFTS